LGAEGNIGCARLGRMETRGMETDRWNWSRDLKA